MRTLCLRNILGQFPSQKVTQSELGDMGRRPAAGKSVKPKMFNFASNLVLTLNQWQVCCGMEKSNKQGIVSKAEPKFFDNICIL